MTIRSTLVTVAACAAALTFAAVPAAAAAPAAPAVRGHGLKKVHDPGRVTGTVRVTVGAASCSTST